MAITQKTLVNTDVLVDTDGLGGHRLVVSDGGSGLGVQYRDNTGNMDAFGRLRVSNPTTLFDTEFEYDADVFNWAQKLTNSGSAVHSASKAAVVMSVSDNDSVIRQTKSYHRYQPGKSQFVLMTFVMGASANGLEQKIGYFDDENGIFLESASGTVNIVRRSGVNGAPADNKVAQSSWNLNTLDGNDGTGIAIDLTKSQIFFVDLEWLGVGRARTGFVIDGKFYYAHEFLNTNNLANVYMRTANLPLRYEITGGSGLGARSSMSQICSTVMSEGGFEVTKGNTFSVSNAGSLISATANKRPILSIRSASVFNGRTNRAQILPLHSHLFSEDSNAYYEMVYGGVLSDPVWTNVGPDSAAEYDVSASVITGGVVVETEFVPTGRSGGATGFQDFFQRAPLAIDIDGAQPTSSPTNVLTIVAQRVGATNTDVSGALTWMEIK